MSSRQPQASSNKTFLGCVKYNSLNTVSSCAPAISFSTCMKYSLFITLCGMSYVILV